MDSRLQLLSQAQKGAFSTADARRIGLTDIQIHRLVRSGDLVRVRRGAFVDGALYATAPPEERYRLAALAILRSRPGDIASHHMALSVMGLPLWGVDLRRYDVCTSVKRVAVCRGLVKHPTPGGVVLRWPDGLASLDAARAIMSTAATSGVEAGLVAADRALHDKRVTLDELALVAENAAGALARSRGRDVVYLADPTCESVGETRTRLILKSCGLSFASQVPISERGQAAFAYADFVVEGCVVVEFDGRLKYQADDANPRAASDAVWREKRREDRIRALGYEVVRLTWSDLEYPDRVLRAIREALARGAGRGAGARRTALPRRR